MFKGIFFLLKYAWKYEKKYIPYQIVLQILTALIPIIDIVFPKYIIDEILRGDSLENVLYLITGMIMLNLMASMLSSFLEGRIFLLQVISSDLKTLNSWILRQKLKNSYMQMAKVLLLS